MIIYVVLAGFILRLISLDQSFWLDEAAQAVISQKSLNEMYFAADFQPPLYYIFSHYWMQLGSYIGLSNEMFLRFPSVLLGAGTIYLLYILVKQAYSERTALVSSALLALAPFHIYYSQEFRMYSALTFLGLLSWLFLMRKKWILYSVTIGIAVFTHYFAFALIASQMVFMAIQSYFSLSTYGKQCKRCFMGAVAAGLVPFLLWLPTFSKQVQTSQKLIKDWPQWTDISNTAFLKFPITFLAKYSVGMISPENRIMYAIITLTVGIVFLCAFYSLFRSFKKINSSQKSLSLLLLVYATCPFLIVWIGGLFVPAGTPTRIQFILPAVCALVGIGLTTMKIGQVNTFKKTGIPLIVLLMTIHAIFSSLYLFDSTYHRENWRDAIAYSDSKLDTNSVAVTEYVGKWAPMDWYSKKSSGYIGGSTHPSITSDTVETRLGILIEKDEPEQFIVYTYLFEISDPDKHVEAFLEKKGYVLTEQKDFRGVGIVNTYSHSARR